MTNPLFLPGGKVHQVPMHKSSVPERPEYFEPYPDEYAKIQAVGQKIEQRFKFKNIHNDQWPDFIEYVIDEFEKIGFEVAVEIMDAVNGEGRPIIGSDGNPMRAPSISFVGRTGQKEYEADHDRIRHGIVTGKVDGRKGYIREGSPELHEDPIKKNIY